MARFAGNIQSAAEFMNGQDSPAADIMDIDIRQRTGVGEQGQGKQQGGHEMAHEGLRQSGHDL
jgi:hypothetical protein